MNILLVDDEPNVLKTLTICLNSMGLNVTACKGPLEALDAMREHPGIDIAFLDLKMYPIDGIELMMRIRQVNPGITVVIITAHGTVDTAVEAIKKGAYDYLQKPFDLDELRRFIEKTLSYHELKKENGRLRSELEGLRVGSARIVTRSPAMLGLIALAERIADTPLAVLIEGESGTGKELFAELIHEKSARRAHELVRVNCAALPENLLESELFGHTKGAFTGAHKDRIGRFELADKGTIFLDEVGELPLQLQAKLLRVLQSHEFERLGESRTRSVDVRVIAATNRDLSAEIAAGRFREDLFYRLNTVRIKIPPLRERQEDIPLLAQYLIDKHVPEDRKGMKLSVEALAAIAAYQWKGNVRELENVISRAVFLARSGEIKVEDLPEEFRAVAGIAAASLTLEGMERDHIARVIAESKSFEEAARKLDIDAATLWRKRRKYNL
ncbi:MAG TPA: sigma-54 dependent transcriptional regulator [Candidatus Kapabacteria bacterium]|nr:sigma-54 dependent transcriptional regulator [Candidatus Kapabacteria bacterium]